MGQRFELDFPWQWDSPFLPAEFMKAASGDITLSFESMNMGFGDGLDLKRNMSRAWADLSRVATQRVAGVSGIDSNIAPFVIDGLSQFTPLLRGEDMDWEEFAFQMAETGLVIAQAALSAIPVAALIVKGIEHTVSLVHMIRNYVKSKNESTPPILLPMPQYSEHVDEVVTNFHMNRLDSFSWTDLFMPPTTGDWYMERRGAHPGDTKTIGWAVYQRHDARGAGCIPGMQSVTGARFVAYNVPGTKQERNSPGAWKSVDRGAFYPGLMQMSSLVSGQVTHPQTQMWNVHPDILKAAWYEYLGSLYEFARDVYYGVYRENGLGGLTEGERQWFARAMMYGFAEYVGISYKDETLYVYNGDFTVSADSFLEGKPDSDHRYPSIYGKYIKPWCDSLRKRQRYYLDTTKLALAAREGDAFLRSTPVASDYGELLDRRRLQLLDHGDRFMVNPVDIVDPDYQQAFREARGDSGMVFTQDLQLRTEPKDGATIVPDPAKNAKRVEKMAPPPPVDGIPTPGPGPTSTITPSSTAEYAMLAIVAASLGGWAMTKKKK